MANTANLALPFIEAAQAQKHVTHNQALRVLDAVVQLAVVAVNSAPPGEPADGERHIVGPAPSGVFTGHENEIAVFQDGGWTFLAPRAGWRAWDIAAETLRIWSGSAWVEFTTAGPDDRVTVDYLGVGEPHDNTSTDTSNRLVVRGSRATFFAIPDSETPGTGDFKVQISKEALANSASFFLSNNFSARAEVGLIESDDFQIKVSPDGSTFYEGLSIRRTDGHVGLAGFIADSNDFGVKATNMMFDKRTDDIRALFNKAAAGDEASIAFQTNFSPRAVFGLIDDDHFRVKVSPDGSTFYPGLVINKDNGFVAFHDTPDAFNKLLVSGENIMFTNGGQLNFNMSKGAAGDNLQLIFMTNFSQRAAFGLLADDDFCIQVSPNGSNFFRTLRAHRNLYGRATVRDSARRQASEWRPRPNSTTVDQLGLGMTISAGTATAAAVASTTMWTQAKRAMFASAAAAGSSVQVHGNDLVVYLGNSGERGGWFLLIRFAVDVYPAQTRVFAGLRGALTAIGNVNPSTLTNVIGIGYDSGETQMSLIHNDGAGGATKTGLGAGFAVGGHEFYELMLAAEPNSSEVKYRVERLNGANVATGTINTDLPANTQFLTPVLWGNNGTTASAITLGFACMYLENASLFGSRGFATE
jgi:hypothetical protein